MRSPNDWISLLETVPDPEIPVLNVIEMGIVRSVECLDNTIVIKITPTYMGCPAMDAIADDIGSKLGAIAKEESKTLRVELVYSPAWTTDWLDDAAKAKLEKYGIAPPVQTSDKRALQGEPTEIQCPHCKSKDTRLVSLFGSTACKAHYQCNSCSEPFDYFKCI